MIKSLWVKFLIFLIFVKVGTVSFGGAYSIWAVIEQEFVERNPLATQHAAPLLQDNFHRFMEIGQLTPGPNINGALLVGDHYLGLSGILIAFLGLLLPSVIAIIAMVQLNRRFGLNPAFRHFKQGALAAVIGILAYFLLKLGQQIPHENLLKIFIFGAQVLLALYLIHVRKFNVLVVTLICGTLSWLTHLVSPML